MSRFKKKGSIWLSLALVAIVALGAFGFVNLFKRVDNLEPYKTVSSSAYARGLLDDETGKLPKDSSDIDYSGIHMKSFINADGLTCTLKDGAKIKYQINFFDEDYQFIGVSDKLTEDYDGTENPEGASFVLIEIIPTADADGIVSTFEMNSYAKQLTVTYNK